MKKILTIELYELQFEEKYLLAFVDNSDKELFAKTISRKNKGKLYTTIIKQLAITFKELIT